MADIVNSLFGLPSEDVRQQLYQQQQDFSTQYANTYGNEYDKRNALLGGIVGNAVANLGAGIFGVQDPRLKRATTLESILQSTQQELGENVNNPAVLYPALQQRLAEAGFSREAMQVGQVGQKAMQEAQLNQAKIGQEQAQMQQYQAQTAIKQQEVAKEEQLRSAVAALPANATDDEYLDVVRKFAPAKDVMNVIEKKQLANEARQAKTEDLQLRLEEETKRARERNETLLEQARLQGANARDLATMRINSNESIAVMDANNKRAIAELKGATTAAAKGAPKDVAEAESVLAGVDFTISQISKAKDLLDTGKAVFSLKQNAIARGSLASGNPTANALAQNEVKRQVREGVNQILVAAKGTQTEGDAKRAQEMYLAAENANSTEAWKDAMSALLKAQEKVKSEKKTYIKSRGFGTTSNVQDPLGIRK